MKKLIITLSIIFLIVLTCSCPFIICSLSAFIPQNNISTDFNSVVSYPSNYRFAEKPVLFTSEKENNSGSKIAVINITGAITYTLEEEPTPSYGSSNVIVEQLNQALEDESVKAVVLRLNTPGGEVSAADAICSSIKKVNEKKPVYAFIDSEAASLGYLIANCTKYIYSTPLSVTASIGVISVLVDFMGVIERIGGNVQVITNTDGKSKLSGGLFDENSEGYKSYKSLLDQAYDKFIDYVYTGRVKNFPEISKEEIKKIADGRVMSGKSAKDLKLVDDLAEYREIREKISQKENLGEVQMVEYVLPKDFFSGFLDSFGLAGITKSNLKSGNKLLMQSIATENR